MLDQPYEQGSNRVEIRSDEELLKVPLTGQEKADLQSNMLEAMDNIESAEAELAAVKSQYKAKIDGFASNLKDLRISLRNGFEHRKVQIKIIKDYTLKKVLKVRGDTGCVYFTREMDEAEKQRGLEFQEESEPEE
jgi:hypothetical protein